MCSLYFITEAALIYNLSFLQLTPKYTCIDSNGKNFDCPRLKTCLDEYNNDFTDLIRSNNATQFDTLNLTSGFYVNHTSQKVLQNWVEDMDLRCKSSEAIGMIGSVFFIGQAMGSAVLSQYADTVGRISMMRLSQTISVKIYFAIIFLVRDTMVIYVLLFIFGFISCLRMNAAYIYGVEILKSNQQALYGAIVHVFDSNVMIMSSLFYLYCSNDWVHLHCIFATMATVALTMSFFYPDSP